MAQMKKQTKTPEKELNEMEIHIRAPPCSCIADSPWRAEVGGQWSQPILAADWPG